MADCSGEVATVDPPEMDGHVSFKVFSDDPMDVPFADSFSFDRDYCSNVAVDAFEITCEDDVSNCKGTISTIDSNLFTITEGPGQDADTGATLSCGCELVTYDFANKVIKLDSEDWENSGPRNLEFEVRGWVTTQSSVDISSLTPYTFEIKVT